MAERAARLAKADLVTGMVGEFPELQGLMGGYYAATQGEDPRVAAAVRDHYKPVGQGDDVPTDPVTVAVSLADKLDTVSVFWVVDILPTGSKDPFALRRAVIATIDLAFSNQLRMPLAKVVATAMSDVSRLVAAREVKENDGFASQLMCESQKLADDATAAGRSLEPNEVSDGLEEFLRVRIRQVAADKVSRALETLVPFFADRLKVQQREAGVRHDLIDAVFALGGEDDLVRLLARVHALQAFVGTEDGANLLAGYKRAANILKKEGYAPSLSGEGLSLTYAPEPAEAALTVALDSAEPAAAAAVAREDFGAAMAALATLRAPIDAFFETVTVNDLDAAKRTARLALLARVRAAVHGVADFSKIEG